MQFAKEFGVTVGDLPELKPLSPEATADMERIKALSVEVMESLESAEREAGKAYA